MILADHRLLSLLPLFFIMKGIIPVVTASLDSLFCFETYLNALETVSQF